MLSMVLSEYSFVNMFCRSCNMLFRVKFTSEINIARRLANQTAAGNCYKFTRGNGLHANLISAFFLMFSHFPYM